jgi:hypothetical protein
VPDSGAEDHRNTIVSFWSWTNPVLEELGERLQTRKDQLLKVAGGSQSLIYRGMRVQAAAIGIGGTSPIRESGIKQASGLEYQLRLETFVGLFRPLNWPLKHPALSERPSND